MEKSAFEFDEEKGCMIKRLLAVMLLVTALAVAVAPSQTEAKSVPTCQGKKATQWLTSPGALSFTAGDDVLVGSSGADVFVEGDSGGTDLVCGNGGNDVIQVSGVGSAAYGGTGDDWIQVTTAPRGYGESGNDEVDAFDSYADGGPDNDHIYITGNSSGDAGAGDDTIYAYGATGDIYGGPGNDRIDGSGTFGTVDCGQNEDANYLDAQIGIVKRCEVNQVPT